MVFAIASKRPFTTYRIQSLVVYMVSKIYIVFWIYIYRTCICNINIIMKAYNIVDDHKHVEMLSLFSFEYAYLISDIAERFQKPDFVITVLLLTNLCFHKGYV